MIFRNEHLNANVSINVYINKNRKVHNMKAVPVGKVKRSVFFWLEAWLPRTLIWKIDEKHCLCYSQV